MPLVPKPPNGTSGTNVPGLDNSRVVPCGVPCNSGGGPEFAWYSLSPFGTLLAHHAGTFQMPNIVGIGPRRVALF